MREFEGGALVIIEPAYQAIIDVERDLQRTKDLLDFRKRSDRLTLNTSLLLEVGSSLATVVVRDVSFSGAGRARRIL